MVGFDNAGKNTILSKLHLGVIEAASPDPGFSVRTTSYRSVKFTVWDLGFEQYRAYWKQYIRPLTGIIFVVDSNDPGCFDKAREELHYLLSRVPFVPLLVLVHKQDLPDAVSASEIYRQLDLQSIKERKWYLQASATNDNGADGIQEGLEWLAPNMIHSVEQVILSAQVGPFPAITFEQYGL
ncbi:ADP-ribosylation factor [Ceratobasidium sp. AG-I]|nr:ADP-ribosylation factor [Ceratobasidium sp. AG-I]